MDDILPLFVVPKPGELLSSWLFRLSFNHYQKTYTFYKNHFHNVSNWTLDIDRYLSEVFLSQLETRTPYTIDEIKELSLNYYTDRLFLKDNPNGVNKWILSTGFRSRSVRKPYLNYCPKCFDEGYLYFLKEWRLSIFNSCSRCGTYLQNTCPHCGAVIIVYRTDIGRKTFYFDIGIGCCGKCEKPIGSPVSNIAPAEIIRMEHFFRQVIETGWHPHFGYSFIYFDTLYQVTRCIIKLKDGTSKKRLQDYLPIERAGFIHQAFCLLINFPHNIEAFGRDNLLSASFWLKDYYVDWFEYKDQVTWRLNKLRLTSFG